MFWDLYQQHQIYSLSREASRANNNADKAAVYLEQLENKVDSLALACQSLWEIIQDTTGITQEQLEAKMEEIDLRDGKKDGRLSQTADTCQQCGRKTSRRRPICLYCGASNDNGELFGKHFKG